MGLGWRIRPASWMARAQGQQGRFDRRGAVGRPARATAPRRARRCGPRPPACSSRPEGVMAPSSSSTPRVDERRPPPASHCSSDQPRVGWMTSRGEPPAAPARTWAWQPSMPAAVRAALWPSPRCSRRQVSAVPQREVRLVRPRQRGVGREQGAPVDRGAPRPRPAASAAVAATAGSSTAASPRTARSAASIPARRAASAVGGRRQVPHRRGSPAPPCRRRSRRTSR